MRGGEGKRKEGGAVVEILRFYRVEFAQLEVCGAKTLAGTAAG